MKPFKTIDEQIEILKSRNLTINDNEKAKKYLLTNNYYNIINGYSKYFQTAQNTYLPDSSFDEIACLHFFDTEIKNILLKSIIQAENHLRHILSYRYSEHYKDIRFSYLKTDSYDTDKILDVGYIISRLSQIINTHKKSRHNNSIKHHLNNHDDVPIWVLVNYLTFGELYALISNLPTNLINKIALDLVSFIESNNITRTLPFTPELLISFTKNINEVRNVCAHNKRLIGFNCKSDVGYYHDLHNSYSILNSSERRSVYHVFLTMQCFLTKYQYAILHNTILKKFHNLDKKLSSISINVILIGLGFPEDWHINTKKLTQ